MAHTHTWRLHHLLVGLPDQEGYVRKVLTRACTTCPYAECLHGALNLTTRRHRLFPWWDAWGPRGLLSSHEEAQRHR
jgi:hypothetical protein